MSKVMISWTSSTRSEAWPSSRRPTESRCERRARRAGCPTSRQVPPFSSPVLLPPTSNLRMSPSKSIAAAELGQARRAEQTFLRDTLDRVAEHRIDRARIGATLERLEFRPVFTAHPTESRAPFGSVEAARRGPSGPSPWS